LRLPLVQGLAALLAYRPPGFSLRLAAARMVCAAAWALRSLRSRCQAVASWLCCWRITLRSSRSCAASWPHARFCRLREVAWVRVTVSVWVANAGCCEAVTNSHLAWVSSRLAASKTQPGQCRSAASSPTGATTKRPEEPLTAGSLRTVSCVAGTKHRSTFRGCPDASALRARGCDLLFSPLPPLLTRDPRLAGTVSRYWDSPVAPRSCL